MTLWLILIAVAHQGDILLAPQFLNQSQRKFLAVVLDAAIAPVDAATLPKLSSVTATKLGPGNAIASRCIE